MGGRESEEDIMSSLKYWVWLASLSGVGAATAVKLLRRFGSPEQVYAAGAGEYSSVEGIGPDDIRRITKKNIDDADKVLSSCAKIGCRIVTLQDAGYPDRLRNIYDPPVVLYYKGNLPAIDDEPVVAIVGTRDCTPYGVKAAENAGYRLSRSGLTVVTGLARGIDSAATRGALRGKGSVLGVIGSGLDIVYPAENKDLFNDVITAGAILSEYPPGTPAIAAHFPARNRILSGLSIGVAVIEAPKKSGALITAARALEQGRDVFALPGNVDARSCEGSNALLREGAIPFLSGEDIISEYAGLYPDRIITDTGALAEGGKKLNPKEDKQPRGHGPDNGNPQMSRSRSFGKKGIDNIAEVDYIDLDAVLSSLEGDEKAVAQAMGMAKLQVDEIIADSGLPATRVLTALTMIEIKGHAVRDGSGRWILIDHSGGLVVNGD